MPIAIGKQAYTTSHAMPNRLSVWNRSMCTRLRISVIVVKNSTVGMASRAPDHVGRRADPSSRIAEDQ